MNKYKWLLALAALFFFLPLQAQIEDPVDWSFSTKDLGDGTYELVLSAKVDPGWHIYSQFTSEDGPIPTAFTFESKENAELQGDTREFGEVEKGYDEIFMTDVSTFKGDATFRQKVKVNGGEGKISGYVTYMVCNDEKCLPPTDEEFSFTLKGKEKTSIDNHQPPKEEKTPQKDNSSAKTNPVLTPQPNGQEDRSEPEPQSPVEEEESNASLSPLQNQENQVFDPVSWKLIQEKVEDGLYKLTFSARIEKGWKIYAPGKDRGGPIPLNFSYEKGDYELKGELKASREPRKAYDKIFQLELSSYEDSVSFTQQIAASKPVKVEGYLTFMACDKERCLPPIDFEFSLELGGEREIPMAGEMFTATAKENPFRRASIDRNAPVAACTETEDYTNVWSLFFKGIFWGIFALLTPCIFPMIPLTVSFFTKSSQNRRQGILNGAIYGLSIFTIYALVSLPFHLIPGLDANVFNIIATDPILNLIFFAIFVVFAFSFFGFFEITLPSAVANQADKGSSVGGLLGIFFMALTLTIVSFSCTGPLFGNVFALSASDFVSPWSVTAAAAGFGVALGLPFALFAAFPGLLNAMPKSGGWLNTLKIILGFIEIALAIKFLSNADLVAHWGILKREVFVGIWMLISLMLGLYLLGFIKFPHDHVPKPLPWRRVAGALVCAGFIAYLVPGFWTTRPLIAGFLPPMYYSVVEQDTECPHDLNCFRDYEEGLAYAREVNKPIMIDFTGYACVNCRNMEENVWPKQEIMKYISGDYVLISLYVDDREKLEEPLVISDGNGGTKKLRTVGSKWAEFQSVNFYNNSQPFYVLMSPEEVLLNNPVGYEPDVNKYEEFLECGLNAFEQVAQK